MSILFLADTIDCSTITTDKQKVDNVVLLPNAKQMKIQFALHVFSILLLITNVGIRILGKLYLV